MASAAAQSSLTAASSGAGNTVDFATAKKTVTAVVIPLGTVAFGALVIEASQDNINFVPIQTVAIDQDRPRGISLNGQAYRYWRASIVKDIAGGGRVSVTFMEAD